jgi:hypothetical protein
VFGGHEFAGTSVRGPGMTRLRLVSEQPERAKHLELRASDADRERVAKILHDAMGEGRLTLAELDERLQSTYAAKTLGDLVPLTADLPVLGATYPVAAPGANLPDERVVGGGANTGPNVSIGILSGFERRGNWIVPPVHTALAMLGGGELDLSEARFAEQETVIYAYAFMGGIEIRVPDDVTVHIEGFGFMGGFEHKAAGDAGPGKPVIRIRGLAVMGGVDVKRPRKPKQKKLKNS